MDEDEADVLAYMCESAPNRDPHPKCRKPLT
jgi:hypothetical protein